MEKLKRFILTSLMGGLIVILPIAILSGVFGWVVKTITKIISPVTRILMIHSGYREMVANIFVIILIFSVCFFVGVIIRTRLGKYLHFIIEKRLLSVAPGYNLIKDTIFQLLGNKKSAFSSVALAQIFCNETLVTCFITDESPLGFYTIFVPTGPNPTSGNIYHLKKKYVHLIDVSVEEAMKSIISCGAGSHKFADRYFGNIKLL